MSRRTSRKLHKAGHGALALLVLLYVLTLATGASHPSARAGPLVPLELQVLCHPGSAPQPQHPDNEPPCPSTCCTLCCGVTPAGTLAPPAATRHDVASLPATGRCGPAADTPVPRHQAQRLALARGPPPPA